MNKKNKRILIVFSFLIMFIIIPIGSNNNIKNVDGTLNTSTENYLFNGVEYDIELNDIYDDENLTKIYTGANFQTSSFNYTTYDWNDSESDPVSPVNNTEIDKASPSGHYPATYSFEEYADGTEGYDITDFVDYYDADTDTSGKIISEFDDHKKVIELDDQSAVGHITLYHYLDYTEPNTIIDFWLSITITSGYRNLYIYLYDQNGANTIRLCLTNNLLRYDSGSGDTTIYTFTVNTFFNVKMIMDDTADTYDIYVNDDLKESDITYRVPSTANLYRLYFSTRDSNTGYKVYIDGVGYSSDPEYTPFGHHAGTYSFTNDDVGSSPEGWGASANFEVEESFLGHNKVIAGIGDGNLRGITRTFDEWQSGTSIIEWYWNLNSYSHSYIMINLRDTLDNTITQRMIAYGASATPFIGCDNGGYLYPSAGGWHHYKVEIDCPNNLISYWLDEELILEDKPFRDNFEPDYITSIGIYFSAGVPIGEKVYWDAFGFSFDPYYTIGDNLYVSTGNVYPDNINMYKGTYDYTDNMKINDASYSTFTSTHTDGYIPEMPSQWDNFTFTNGTGDTIGDLETIDADYSVIEPARSGGSEEDFMRPNADYLVGGWTIEGTTDAWENLDDPIEQPSTGYDAWEVYTTTNYLYLGLGLTSVDALITGYEFWVYHKLLATGETIRCYIDYNDGGDYIQLGDFHDIPYGQGWQLLHTESDLNKMGNGWGIRLRPSSINPAQYKVYVIYLKVYYEVLETDLDVQVDIQITDPYLSSIEYLKYSHKTNVSTTIDLDIWNWDTTTWYEIESVDNSATFDDDSFTLGSSSDYVSGTNQVRIRFQALGLSNDFELQIDRFRLDYLTTITADLEMEIDFSFAQYNEDLLAMNVQSWQKTNISQTIVFKIWNYDTELYVQISSSSETGFTKKEYTTESPNDFISSSGVVKLQWSGSDIFDDFELHIDYLFIKIFYKMDLSHSITFETNGIWKYRWELIGSLQYTDWTYFEVVDSVPNFYAISESDMTTRWILQGSDISPIEDFNDDINTDYWDFFGASELNISAGSVISVEDSRVNYNNPDSNYGSDSLIYIGYWSAIYDKAYFKFDYSSLDYLVSNGSGAILRLWDYERTPMYDHNFMVDIYETSDFDEDTITWNNAPATIGSPLNTYNATEPSFEEYSYLNMGDLKEYYVLQQDPLEWENYWWFFSHDEGVESRRPLIYPVVYKNYFGGGYMYMQTNTTELIGLKSKDYGSHKTLNSGDYFEVDFQTNSDSQIDLVLLKDGEVQTTLILSQSGNTNFDRHTAQISVSEDLEFDQLKISSTFEDTDNIKVYDIKTYKYTIVGDYADFYVGSRRDHSIYLSPDTYNLRIFEEGTKKIDTNVTITSSDYQYIFQPTPTFQCRLTLHSVEGINLDLTEFHILVNRSNGGSYSEFSLLDNSFDVDEGTMIYFEVSDRFDNLIDEFQQVASDYIDLELEVYQLQIKNLMEQQTTVDINGTQTFPVLSGELIKHILSKNYYEIGYYDMDNDYHQFLIYLDSNQAYELNRSKICFLSYADQQGNHLSFDNYKTYINGSMIYEQIFYEDAGDHVNITITDRYDYEVYQDVYIVASGDNYIPITMTMYSLKICNQQLTFNHINITRDSAYYSSPYYWSEWIAPSEIIEFSLFSGYYKVNLTDVENEGNTIYDITLTSDKIMLISSYNTLYNVLVNLANVNTTIGTQITSVQIDLTNQNTAINNSIVSVVINIESINSTLGSLLLDIDTSITNIETSIVSEIVSLGVDIDNVNSSISSQILTISADISNLDTSITSQFATLGVSIENINGSIINQIVSLGVDLTNINTSLSNQILSLEVDISNIDALIVEQILLVIADIENIETVIDDQTLVILADITNLNSTLLNQMVSLGVDITNINATIINQILDMQVDLTNINSSISNLLTNLGLNIINLESDIGTFFTFTNNSFINLNTNVNNSFIYLENNIISINQTISTLVIGIDNQISILNGTITTMFTEMNNQFIVTQTTIDYSFTFLNQSVLQLANDIEDNQIVLYNLIEQRTNDIDNNILNIQTLVNLLNSSVANESLVIQTLVNILGNNISSNFITINNLLNLIDNNITNNNIQIISILELIGNNITTNHFIIQTLIDVIGNNITDNHIELLTNLNLINTTIGQNQIELINRILLINSTINDLFFELTNQIYFINDTIYTAVLELSTSVEFGVDVILGNLTLTYQQNEFLTELYKKTMFSQLLNWSGVAYNYSLMEDRIDLWEFINNYRNDSITVFLKYGDLIDNLTITSQNSIEQFLPNTDVEYRLWSEELQEYIGEWTSLPENKTVNFGFYDEELPEIPDFNAPNIVLMIILIVIACSFPIVIIGYVANRYRKKSEVYRKSYADKITLEAQTIKKFSQGRRIK